MRWVAIFDDTAAMLQLRARHAAAHLVYQRACDTETLIAGGLHDAPGGPFVGGELDKVGAAR